MKVIIVVLALCAVGVHCDNTQAITAARAFVSEVNAYLAKVPEVNQARPQMITLFAAGQKLIQELATIPGKCAEEDTKVQTAIDNLIKSTNLCAPPLAVTSNPVAIVPILIEGIIARDCINGQDCTVKLNNAVAENTPLLKAAVAQIANIDFCYQAAMNAFAVASESIIVEAKACAGTP